MGTVTMLVIYTGYVLLNVMASTQSRASIVGLTEEKSLCASWPAYSGRSGDGSQRASSDSPRMNAFWRVAPSVRFKVLAMRPACVFWRASDRKVLTSDEVHSRRFTALLAIK
jgi:hypothetical protein